MPVHISTLVLAKILITFSSVKFLYFTPIQYLRLVAIFFIFFLESPSDKGRRDGEKRDTFSLSQLFLTFLL
jgi:hypothetical protein